MSSKGYGLERSRLGAALFAALVMPVAGTAFAQDAGATQDQTPTATDAKATNLDKIVVTGSLIPQTSIETFKPVTIISAEDLKNRGFTSVQQALHESSFATGGVQGNQTSASFTQGAETNSLFGLDPRIHQVPDRRSPDGELPGAVQRHQHVQQHQRHSGRARRAHRNPAGRPVLPVRLRRDRRRGQRHSQEEARRQRGQRPPGLVRRWRWRQPAHQLRHQRRQRRRPLQQPAGRAVREDRPDLGLRPRPDQAVQPARLQRCGSARRPRLAGVQPVHQLSLR